MKAYWFSKEDGTSEYLTNTAEIGRTDEVEGDIIPCRNGLHASPTPFHALEYGCGPILWEVEIGDDAVPDGDPVNKFASRARTYLRKVDLTPVMRQFAAQQALSVAHLWEMPSIVSEYLKAEADGVDRSDIRDAARDAAWAAARDAARYTAWDAARAAARDAARAAAWDAARDAAWDAAWHAAWDAAWDAARYTAWDAARAAAWYTAWDAARAAARDQFSQMALEALDAA